MANLGRALTWQKWVHPPLAVLSALAHGLVIAFVITAPSDNANLVNIFFSRALIISGIMFALFSGALIFCWPRFRRMRIAIIYHSAANALAILGIISLLFGSPQISAGI